MNLLPEDFIRIVTRPESNWRNIFDLFGVPVRFLFPDPWVERLGLTSLRCARMRIVLNYMHGRCLDIGCQDNLLIRTYRFLSDNSSRGSEGVDVFDWGGDGIIVTSSDHLPFPSESFDTISIVAALNHIPERNATLLECNRLLKPGGQLLVTMISPFIGNISHRIRFWGEHSHRHVQEGELFGLSSSNVITMMNKAGFSNVQVVKFLLRMNNLFIAQK